MEIVYYPDPALRRRAAPVTLPREGLADLARAMLLAMKEAEGVGLAAPQVAEDVRMFVASETGEIAHALVCVNPVVQPFGPAVEFEEGCLSLPGVRAVITRPEGARMVWEDLDGTRHEGEFHALLARILQHEYDHLEGVLFFDRMTPADRLRVRADLDAFEAQYRPR